MHTKYEELVNVNRIGKDTDLDFNKLITLAKKEGLKPARKDAVKRLFIAIDFQRDFMEGGALEVKGATQDVKNATIFLYNNMEKISKIICSLDTHMPYQIFHSCWWQDNEGKNPEPYTIISYDDVKSKKWRPVKESFKTEEYMKHLEKDAKKKLCIWPYHCIQGTKGANLEGEFSKLVHFHSTARDVVNLMIPKGMEPSSEMYGIIEPEYSTTDFKNVIVLNFIEIYDEIYVAGEAASHCVLESLKQIAKHFDGRTAITKKIVVLTDCMSCIPGYEEETKKEFEALRKNFKITFAKSSEIQLK